MIDWRVSLWYPWVARLPSNLPWHLARWIGREPATQQQATSRFLVGLWSNLFSGYAPDVYWDWANRHRMLMAWEMADAMAFHRLGRSGGPRIAVVDDARVLQAIRVGRQGTILVVNHWDRLLTAPVAVARTGVRVNVLTMPVLNNPELGPAWRDFLLRKIAGFVRETGGRWVTTDQPLRDVHRDLEQGGVWLILADAWRQEFSRWREHPFLGGQLRLPTGVERLARATQSRLVYAWTDSEGPSALRVTFRPLDGDPLHAIDTVVAHLEQSIRRSPWRWWQWGLFGRMWSPYPGGGI
ncbi:MAG: hypothetical protein AB1371_08625 [Pseudomonadota bacterium]